jgi:hypothetical protein
VAAIEIGRSIAFGLAAGLAANACLARLMRSHLYGLPEDGARSCLGAIPPAKHKRKVALVRLDDIETDLGWLTVLKQVDC